MKRPRPRAREHPQSPITSVFASYSRKDALLVRQLLSLYRAIDVPTFIDEQSIKPGQKWRVEIDAALEQCQTILVFWCEHAVQSPEVRSEYERAVSLGKRVVPVLIDDTALPPDLGQYQGVDLRTTFSERHSSNITGLRGSFRRIPKRGGTSEKAMKKYKMIAHVDRTIARASRQLKSSLNAIFDQ
jgi:hypothetical protein